MFVFVGISVKNQTLAACCLFTF